MTLYDCKYETYRYYCNPFLLNLVPQGVKVLDVGCSGGQFGEQLILHKGCTVFGVDISANAIEDAQKRLHSALQMNIEEDAFPFADQYFDLVIFGDVLEHLRDPASVLSDFSSHLKPDGMLLTSLPNVAHIGIRIRLFCGRWNYQSSGIMDDSHLRFFTLTTARKMLRDAGFEIIRFDVSPKLNTRLLRHLPFLTGLVKGLCKLFPRLLAYQFLFLCRRHQ